MAGDELAVRDPFPGSTTTPAAAFLFVATFSAAQISAAALATRMVAFLRRRERLEEHLLADRQDTLRTLAAKEMPTVSMLVIADTGQVVQASKHFIHRMMLHNEGIVGREVFTLIRFADPDAVKQLFARGGVLVSCRYAVGPEERTAEVLAETFDHDGMRYANVVIRDEDPTP
jgi:hypothetical protein